MHPCTTVSTLTPWSDCGAAYTRRGAGTSCSRRHQGIRSARSPAGIIRRAITARCTPATPTCSCSRVACLRRTGSRTWPRRSSHTLAPIGSPGTVSSRSNGSEERTGLRPRYRRAFGCVTWVYMGMLVFLAANFLLVLPSRYLGSGELYRYLPPTLAYLGTLLILPGMVLAALLGGPDIPDATHARDSRWGRGRSPDRLQRLFRPRLARYRLRAEPARPGLPNSCLPRPRREPRLLRLRSTDARCHGPRHIRPVHQSRRFRATAHPRLCRVDAGGACGARSSGDGSGSPRYWGGFDLYRIRSHRRLC